MKLTISIEMDNAAFEEDYAGSEAARILRNAASKLVGRGLCSTGELFKVRDSNGNTVGSVEVSE